jgi:PAS domain S-box-containing protein
MKTEIEGRKRIEEALKASEQKYRSVIDNIGIGIALISPRMEILTLNNQMKTWFPHVDPDQKPVCYRSFNDPPRPDVCTYCPTCKTLQDGEVHESVTETPAGNVIRNFRVISSPIKDTSGHVVAAIEMVDDITDRIRAEQAMKESEARYRTIFETTAAATMIIEEDMTISMVNTEFERQSGYTKAEVEKKMKWTEFIADGEDMLERMIEYHHLRRVNEAAAPRNYEFRFRDKAGLARDAFMTIAIIPGTKMSVASLMDISERRRAEMDLQEREEELKIKSRNLEELNTALKVLLKHREDDREELEERILSNVKELVLPYLEKLKRTPLKGDQLAYMDIIESNLDDILSPFLRKMTSKYLNLTPREIQIATLIREGRTTKEISEVLNISSRAVEFHRDNIRIKLGLKNKKANLRSFLLSLT